MKGTKVTVDLTLHDETTVDKISVCLPRLLLLSLVPQGGDQANSTDKDITVHKTTQSSSLLTLYIAEQKGTMAFLQSAGMQVLAKFNLKSLEAD